MFAFAKTGQPRRTAIHWILIVGSFFVVWAWLLLPASTSAHGHQPAASGPSMTINAGFPNNLYHDGNWVPIQITLKNNGSDFNGSISINAPVSAANSGGPVGATNLSMYQQPVELPPISQKVVTMYVPISTGYQGQTQNITVNLLDNNGHKVKSQQGSLTSINANELFVGILSDQQINMAGLSSALPLSSYASTARPELLTSASMPTRAEALENFDMLVIDNVILSNLTGDQLAALKSWVDQGGTLIAVGGPEWQRTLGTLPSSLLPVSVTGTGSLPAGTDLLPNGSPSRSGPQGLQASDTVPASIPISVATAHPGTHTLLSADGTPLIVQDYVGQGSVYYLAYDPFLEPLASWSGASNLWKGLLIRALGDDFVSRGTVQSGKISNASPSNDIELFLQSLIPNLTPPTWLILVLLLSYILILGPLRLILVRWLKRRDWSWRIVLATIAVFSLLSYGLALVDKGTSIINSSVSVIQLGSSDGTGSSEHVTDYVGVFVPSQGDFHVHIPGATAVEADAGSQDAYYGASPRSATSERTAITTTNTGSDVDLLGVDTWSLRTLVASHDAHTTGGISSHLTYSGNILSGTVSNTLPYDLNDVYLLLGNDFTAVGDLAAGQTKDVQYKVNTSVSQSSAANGLWGPSLADMISASHNRSSYTYNPTTKQSQDELSRHLSMLSALSGEYFCGGGCSMTMPFNPGGPNSNAPIGSSHIASQDPLMLPGAPITLIGWANPQTQTAGKVTINGEVASGTRESMVQAPLNVTFSGAVNVPAAMVNSQIVDIQPGQQSGAQGSTCMLQESGPSVYALQTGSVTFEFTLPDGAQLQKSNMTLTEQQNLNKNISSTACNGSGSQFNDVTHLLVAVYNWQTNSWDGSLVFDANTFTLAFQDAQAYVGPGGRVLVQFSNQDPTIGMSVFNMPAVSLAGTASS